MADIELVIKIPEEDYERLKAYEKAPFNSLTSRVYEAIANGTSLPKGYDSIKMVTNAEEAEEYPISEDIFADILKGAEEFTKMMFKQGQAESESEGNPSFWWKCERCGKLIPYMADFCHECAYELLGEPPKPFYPQVESEDNK